MIRFSLFAVAFVGWTLATAPPLPAAAPNIVLFFVDDLGARDLGCYGSDLYETPHIDALAAQGMLFTRAHAAYPRCVPSRQGLLSGKYPARVESEKNRQGSPHSLPLSEVTFAEALAGGGYRTCYLGKWHLGKAGGGPGDQGFETVIHSGSAGATGSHFAPFGVEKGHEVDHPIVAADGDYLTKRLTDSAVDYIASSPADQPFLMVLAHYAVHTPIEAPEEVKKKYQKILRKSGREVGGKRDDPDLVTDRMGRVKTAQNNPMYAAMVEAVDDSLGRVVQAIRDQGMEDSTVIIVTSDHGGLSTRGLNQGRALATSNAPLRQGKGSIFEGGTRVPLIVHWPGVTMPGSTSGAAVGGTDHYPTFLEIAGQPSMPEQHIDGYSYVAALRGEPHHRPPLVWVKWMARPESTGDTRAVSMIDGDYKIIRWTDEDRVELFDISRDVGETTDLSDQMPERTKTMLTRLIAAEQEQGDHEDLRRRGEKTMQRRAERKAAGADS